MPDRATNSSPENGELEEVIRKLGGLLPSDSKINWQDSRKRCGEILTAYADQCEKSHRITERLAGLNYVTAGDEHHIFDLEDDECRVYKATFGDNFGCSSYFSPHDPELTGKHFHGTGNPNPWFYLHRWWLLNSLGQYQTRFEGFLPPEKSGLLPRVCISQPEVDGNNPGAKELRLAMEKFGFRNISDAAFLNCQGILLTDAYPRNVRIVDGIPVPFDAIAQFAPVKVVEWANTPRTL